MALGMLKSLVHRLGRAYIDTICRREFESQQLLRLNERAIEFRFLFHHLNNLRPIRVLDIGTGTTALPHLIRSCGFLVTATDNIRDYWPEGMFNRHFYVINDDITRTKLKDQVDFIACVSVLEHIRDVDGAIASMFRLLKPGGHIVITCPYKETQYVENVYKMPGSSYGQDLPYICQMYSRMQVNQWLELNNGRLVEQEFWQCWEGELWTFGGAVSPPRQVSATDNHQLTCLLLQKV